MTIVNMNVITAMKLTRRDQKVLSFVVTTFVVSTKVTSSVALLTSVTVDTFCCSTDVKFTVKFQKYNSLIGYVRRYTD